MFSSLFQKLRAFGLGLWPAVGAPSCSVDAVELERLRALQRTVARWAKDDVLIGGEEIAETLTALGFDAEGGVS